MPTIKALTDSDARVLLAQGRAQRTELELKSAKRNLINRDLRLAGSLAPVVAEAIPYASEVVVTADPGHVPSTEAVGPVVVLAQPRPSRRDSDTEALTSSPWASYADGPTGPRPRDWTEGRHRARP